MRQLRLPFDSYIDPYWWHDSNIWKTRRLVSTTSRPCEDAALDNIYYDSRLVRNVTVHIPKLSGLERRIYTLELLAMRECPKWYTVADRHKWIAKRCFLPIYEIKNILDNVSHLLRDLEVYERVMVAIDAEELDFRNTVKEVMKEAM